MNFQTTQIPGVVVVTPEPREDERGFFARVFCREEFAAHGLDPGIEQCSVAYNRRKGTIRGMHYQLPPDGEAKLVRCTMGRIYDVALDLRRNSPAFGKWLALELSAENRSMLYVPEGVAHGYQSLVEETEVFYQISALYKPEASRGVRWNDPAFGIRWPLEDVVLSDRDRTYPDFV